jgi:hypothetical protein
MAGFAFAGGLSAAEGPWSAVDAALGRDGRDVPGEARKYGFPRADLKVVVSGIQVEPALALGSWAAFRKDVKTGHVMAMGDLVLLPSELNPVIRALARGGIAVTAIHNHLAGEQPQIVYVHFGGSGDPANLAAALRTALEKTGTPLGPPAPPPLPTAEQQQVFEAVQSAVGRKGSLAGPVLQIGVPRKGRIEEGGMEIPPGMGMAIALNFQALGQQVATTGDFVLTADEVDPVIKALQGNGIDVTALHSHMLRETPRLFFMHFWGVGSPEAIGAGLKAALNHVATGP